MKKRIAAILLSAPILSGATLLLSFILDRLRFGSLSLLLLFFWMTGVPIVTFSLLNSFNKTSAAEKKQKVIVSCATFLVMVLTVCGCFLLTILPDFKYAESWFRLAMVFSVSWAAICGLLIVINSAMARSFSGKTVFKAFLAAEGIFALAFIALFTYYFADIIRGHDVEIVLLPFSSLVGIMFSYFLGKAMQKKLWALKLALWLLGVLSAKLVAYSVLGTPHELPTADSVSLRFWLVSSAIIFVFAIFGFLKQQRALKQAETAEELPDSESLNS